MSEDKAKLDVEAVKLAAERARSSPLPDAAVPPLLTALKFPLMPWFRIGMRARNAAFPTSNNVPRLNKVWEAQEANRLRAGGEDAKIFMGVKYQRKQNGPFHGKPVSQGIIITIDSEDYVEYCVLMKPTFV
ncbi:hypothetical protein C7999DRAFT_36540 [Corynascus novoguineensis]|uniref:Uncharacterized protein n=1 Tax=Corynascus novoguineensis TaxID=1126955 RepID=A0AAN7CLU3_9PEZI|nr:hypothetical protein C7999DRAFT_36540 [Corynascus novoguineensis]